MKQGLISEGEREEIREEVEYRQERQKYALKNNKKEGRRSAPTATHYVWKLIFLFLLFLTFFLIGSNVPLLIEIKSSPSSSDAPPELELTAEFQMVLYPSVWRNRPQAMTDFFTFFQEISGYPFLSQILIENHRTQYYVKAHKCHAADNIGFRVRNYIWGPNTGTTTLDGKVETCSSVEHCLKAPLMPADEYLEHSFQKLEKDVHPCSHKFSRETRIDNIPYKPYFIECGDVYEYYPYVWSAKHNHEKLTFTEMQYWYSGVYEGEFENGVKFKSDVTICYNTIEEMEKGNILNDVSGEYSLRIWSTHGGHGPWNQTSYDQVADWHQQLCKKFGSLGDYPCPK